MNLDLELCRLAEKIKNLVLIDTTFPGLKFPEFKKDHGNKYICLPGRDAFVLDYAAGIASHGKIAVVYSELLKEVNLVDKTANVKLLNPNLCTESVSAVANAASPVGSALVQNILEFGPSVLI